jgi:hypothetical protein
MSRFLTFPRKWIKPAGLALSLVTLFSLFGALASDAQVLIRADDRSIRYDLIKPAHNFAKVIAYDSSGAITDQYMNEGYISVDSVHGQISFSRSREVPAGNFNFDTSVISTAGPMSLHEIQHPAAHELSITFNKASVDAHANIKNVHSDKTTAIPEGYFDDNIFQDIIGYLPFKKGIKYHVNCYRYESKIDQNNSFDIEYVFDDFLPEGNGGMTECMVLSYTNGYSTGYCWINKKTHINVKEIIKFRKNTYLIFKV